MPYKEIPEGAERVYVTVGKEERVEIGHVEDLAYLPDLLEEVAGTLRQMMTDNRREILQALASVAKANDE